MAWRENTGGHSSTRRMPLIPHCTRPNWDWPRRRSWTASCAGVRSDGTTSFDMIQEEAEPHRGLLHHVEYGDGLAEAFQRNIADLFQPCGIFDRNRDTAADQDLPVLGLAA